MNPIFSKVIFDTVRKITRLCSHCHKTAAYKPKRYGQFYKCKHCGHRFKEKGNIDAARSR
jgi:hypothetical protein